MLDKWLPLISLRIEKYRRVPTPLRSTSPFSDPRPPAPGPRPPQVRVIIKYLFTVFDFTSFDSIRFGSTSFPITTPISTIDGILYNTGVCEKNTPLDKNGHWNVSFQSTKSGAG